MRRRSSLLLALLALAIASLACRFSSPTPVAWVATPSAQALAVTDTVSALTQAPPAEPTETPEAPPLPATEPTATPLAMDGPWLIYPGKDGQHLFAADLEADLFVRLELPAAPMLSDLATGTSPDGETLLLRAGSFDDEAGLSLQSIGPELKVTAVTPLVQPEQLALLRAHPSNTTGQAFQALTYQQGITWRQDLAVFSAALEGRNANLYGWDPKTDKTDLLAERAEQAFGPLWDPSQRNLVFQETALQPSGQTLQANQLAALDYNRQDLVRTLLRVPAGSGLRLLGWTNANYMLLHTVDPQGPSQLRLMGLAGGSPTTLFAGRFDEVAFDPQNGSIVLLIGETAAQVNKQSPGIYVKRTAAANFEIMQLGSFSRLQFHPATGLYSAATSQGVAVFNTDLLSFTLQGQENLAYASDGAWLLAWNGQGAGLFDPQGSRLQSVTEEEVLDAFWQPDGRGFYLVTPSGLYHYRFPLLRAIQVSDDVYPRAPFPHAWLGLP